MALRSLRDILNACRRGWGGGYVEFTRKLNSSVPAEVRTPQEGVAGGRGLVIVDQIAAE